MNHNHDWQKYINRPLFGSAVSNVKGTLGIHSYPGKNVSPRSSPDEEIVKSSPQQEPDIIGEYVPPPGVQVNILNVRRKSTSPPQVHSTSPPLHRSRSVSADVEVNKHRRISSADHRPSVDIPVSHPKPPSATAAAAAVNNPIRIPSNEPLPPPKMRGLSTAASPTKSPTKKGKAIVMVSPPAPHTAQNTPTTPALGLTVTAGKRTPLYTPEHHWPRRKQ